MKPYQSTQYGKGIEITGESHCPSFHHVSMVELEYRNPTSNVLPNSCQTCHLHVSELLADLSGYSAEKGGGMAPETERANHKGYGVRGAQPEDATLC